MYVALTQTASALPFFVFALPAGAIGDIVDRRKLILYTEFWMVGVATVLAVATIGGFMTPWLLLGLTFALSAGDAIETPTWRAILPELVKKEDLAAASALNGIEFNFARAVGPALAGIIIAAVGVGAAFALNVVSFFGVILLVARWKRPVRRRTTPPETVAGATVAALRYVRFSPSVARHDVALRADDVLCECAAGADAIGGQGRERQPDRIRHPTGLLWRGRRPRGAGAAAGALHGGPTEDVASGGVAILGLMTVAAGFLHAMTLLAAAMLVAGAAWIVFISLVSALMQTPGSRLGAGARARGVHAGVPGRSGGRERALGRGGRAAPAFSRHCSGPASASSGPLPVGLVAKLPDTTMDVSPWNHWKMPAIVEDVRPEFDAGPVLVTVEYRVSRDRADEFLQAIHEYGRVRRRDGAFRWGVYRDLEEADRYVETFVVSSWAEHLRQHERVTNADRAVEERLRTYVTGAPTVRHLVSAHAHT